jgi:hypothetical protein
MFIMVELLYGAQGKRIIVNNMEMHYIWAGRGCNDMY